VAYDVSWLQPPDGGCGLFSDEARAESYGGIFVGRIRPLHVRLVWRLGRFRSDPAAQCCGWWSGDDRRFAVRRRRDARVYGFSIGGQISARLVSANDAYMPSAIENRIQVGDIRGMEPTFEQMARSLVESGDYRVTSRLEPQAEYQPSGDPARGSRPTGSSEEHPRSEPGADGLHGTRDGRSAARVQSGLGVLWGYGAQSGDRLGLPFRA
jgi:hypothetical protein